VRAYREETTHFVKSVYTWCSDYSTVMWRTMHCVTKRKYNTCRTSLLATTSLKRFAIHLFGVTKGGGMLLCHVTISNIGRVQRSFVLRLFTLTPITSLTLLLNICPLIFVLTHFERPFSCYANPVSVMAIFFIYAHVSRNTARA
jgi:hypothetical protein